MKYFRVLLICLFAVSCNSEPKEKCKYGNPVAIFSPGTNGVKESKFSVQKGVAVEDVIFENELKLQILQSGCNNILQLFQFTVDRPGEGEPNWFFIAGEQFNYLGNLSPELESLLMWATVINQNAGNFRFGEPLEVDQGFFIKIDKIDSGSKVILTVELSENHYQSN